MKTLFTFFLIFAFCLNASITTKAQVDVNDSLALVDLYNSTNGPSWHNHSGWLTTDPVSTWEGITVTGTRVTLIYLYAFNLTGTIPSSIGNLADLQYLNLELNHLSGSIPSSIGNLVNLQYLYLHVNNLSGSIPYSIGNLVHLIQLLLNNNKLSGSIPSSIGNLVNLQDLELNNNKLSGSIPSSIGNLVNVIGFYLDHNQLSGLIPSSIGNLVNLNQIVLDDNLLRGSIPFSIGNLVNLYYLDLSANQLSGSIPSSIGNLANLHDLRLNNNQLSGEIPHSKNKLKHLNYVDFSYNKLVENTNIEYSSSPDITGKVNNNLFTFNGIEYIAQKLPKVAYAPQAIIPVHQNGNTLSIYAGGTLGNNTYHWFRVGSTGSTVINADSTFQPKQTGKYYASVTNAIATQLTLYSDTVDFTINNLTVNNNLSTDASSKLEQGLHVYPNPANNVVQVQVNGTAKIILTNSAGKVMLARTITNNAFINVNAFAPGTYYIQNKDNGEVKQVVITH
jgi:Leucine-rich repeat (LRR) protein